MFAFLAWTLTYLGYIDRRRSRTNEASTAARQLGHAYTLVFVLSGAAFIESDVTGSPHEEQRYAEEMLDLANEHGFPFGWLGDTFTAGGH